MIFNAQSTMTIISGRKRERQRQTDKETELERERVTTNAPEKTLVPDNDSRCELSKVSNLNSAKLNVTDEQATQSKERRSDID